MSELSPAIKEAIRDVKMAELALRHARERLEMQLPTEWVSDVHYNGVYAKVPQEVYTALRGPR